MRLASLLSGVLALAGSGCRRDSEEVDRKLGFDEFMPVYNRHIIGWVKQQKVITEEEVKKVEAEIATAEGEAKESKLVHLEALRRDQEKWRFREELGDYLKIGKPSDVPQDLVWEDGMDQPEIGDSAAKKGGVFRRYIPTFPPTIRPFGDNSNNSFRSDIYDLIDLPLVNLHPETMEMIPGLAKE